MNKIGNFFCFLNFFHKKKSKFSLSRVLFFLLGLFAGTFSLIFIFFLLHSLLITNSKIFNKENNRIEYFLYDFDNFFFKDNDFVMNGRGSVDLYLKYNDNLFNVFKNNELDYNDAVNVIIALKNKLNLREMQENQKIVVDYTFQFSFVEDKRFERKEEYNYLLPKKCILAEKRNIEQVYFKLKNGKQFFVNRKDGNFIVSSINPKISVKIGIISGMIEEGLFIDALKYDIKPNTLFNMLNEYAFLIDFQRDIHKYDRFVFVLGKEVDEDGDIINERVLYSNLILLGRKYEMFRFDNKYYNREGGSIKRALLKTPVDGAKVSSGFNPKRRHPILGYTKAHTGIDLAVPMGTPIYASGNGTISEIQFNHKGYGKFVTIRHNREYSTRYAHMSRIAPLKVGQKVVQKQVIGYVGMTGMATGPHLHYEVIRNGVFVNPRTIKVVSDKKIDSKDMMKFAKQVEYIDNLLKK